MLNTKDQKPHRFYPYAAFQWLLVKWQGRCSDHFSSEIQSCQQPSGELRQLSHLSQHSVGEEDTSPSSPPPSVYTPSLSTSSKQHIYNMAICSNRFIALCHQSLNLHLGILDSCHFKGLYVNGLGLVISEVLMWPAVMQLHRAKREMPFWGQISGLFGQSPARAALCWGIMCCWICCISTAVKFSNQCKWECRIGYVWLSWWKYFLNLQHRRWHWTVSAQHWTDSNWITALPFFVVLIIELLYSSIWILKLILISGDYPCKAVLTQSILHKRL